MKHVDHSKLTPPKAVNTRNTANSECVCSVCITGRLQGKDYKKYTLENCASIGRPAKTVKSTPDPVTVCSLCLCEYGKGLTHTCTKAAQCENARKIVRNLSEKSKARVIGKVLGEIYEDRGI